MHVQNVFRRWPWMFAGAFLVALIWWAGVRLFLTGIPVGLAFSPGQQGEVGLVVSSSEGEDHVLAWKTIPESGRLSFVVPRTAKRFAFRLKSDRCKTFGFEGVSLFGVVVIDSFQISRFQMVPKLYRDIPERGYPLALHVDKSADLDLPNVFAYILRFSVLSNQRLSIMPFFVVALVGFGMFMKRVADTAILSRLDRPGIFAACLAAELLLTLPKPAWPVLPGLDDSWTWLLNRVAFSGAIGRDMVFTYGPLGFLIHPELSGTNILCGIVFNVLFMALFSSCAWFLYRSGKKLSAYLLLVCFAFPWPNQMEWKWCAISLLACVVPCLSRDCSGKVRCVFFAAAAVSAVLQTFVKFSAFISVVPTQMMMLAFFAVRERGGLREVMLGYVLPGAVAFCSLGWGLFDGLTSCVNWFVGSLEIARGYNEYMVVDKSVFELIFPVLLAGVVAVILFPRGGGWRALSYLVLFAPVLFSATKYAWIRQGPVPLCMILATVSCLLPLGLKDMGKRTVLICVVSLGFAVTGGFLFGGMEEGVSGLSWANLRDTVMPARALHREQAVSKRACAPHRLPESWRTRIGTSPVMFVGYGYGAAMVDPYALVPFPATQIYSAYTPWLDKWCADAVSSEERAPKFIVVCSDPCSFYYQNIFLDNPAFWDAVYAHYQYADANEEYLLLARRNAKRVLPRSESLSMGFRPSAWAKLRSLLFRPRRHWVKIGFTDGQQKIYAVNASLYEEPRTLTALPRNRSEMALFFQDDPFKVSPCSIKTYSTNQ